MIHVTSILVQSDILTVLIPSSPHPPALCATGVSPANTLAPASALDALCPLLTQVFFPI